MRHYKRDYRKILAEDSSHLNVKYTSKVLDLFNFIVYNSLRLQILSAHRNALLSTSFAVEFYP